MSNTKLQAARELIQEKRYAEARAILKTMPNDPTAKKWLEKLDKIAPIRKRRTPYIIAGLVIVVLLVVVIGLFVAILGRNRITAISAENGGIAQVPTLAALPNQTVTSPAQPPTVTPTTTLTLAPTETPIPSTPTFTATTAPSATSTTQPTPMPPPTQLNTPMPTVDTQGWVANRDVSVFDDTVKITVARSADSPIQAWLSSPTPTLILRCNAGKLDVYVNVGTQIAVEYGMTDQASAKIRFDKDSAQDIVMNESTTGDALFFDDPQSILKSIGIHHSLLFGFTPYNSTLASTTFTLDGLGSVIQPRLSACNLGVIPVGVPPTPAACTSEDAAVGISWAKNVQSTIQGLQTVRQASDVQNLRNQIAGFIYPQCLALARQYVLNGLDEAYLSFISSSPDVVKQHSDNAIAQINLFAQELQRVVPGA